MHGARMREAAARLHLYEEMRIARRDRIDIDAADCLIHPTAHGSVRIMVERVHSLILEGAVRLDSIPSLPDRGGTLPDRVKPGWELLAIEQQIRFVDIAEPSQHTEQLRRSEKSRGEVSAQAHIGGELLRCRRTQLIGHQVKVEREYIGRLCARADGAVRCDELALEGGLDLAE